MVYGIIYLATCIINNKRYVGQTIHTLAYRKGEHKHYAKNKQCRHFHSAILKYGFENFTWEQIDIAYSKEELDQKEQYWIDFYDSRNRDKGYNLRGGGSHGKHSTESRKKMSEWQIGEKSPWYGKHHTPETIEKMRKANKGRVSTNKGIPMSEEQKVKIGNANKGKVRSPEACMNISKAKRQKTPIVKLIEYCREHQKGHVCWNKGKTGIYSDETLQKMRDAKKGIYSGKNHPQYGTRQSEETKKKIREAKRGKPLVGQFGEKSHRAKITEAIARAIKTDLAAGMRNIDIARKYNVSRSIVGNIKNGSTWAWLEAEGAA